MGAASSKGGGMLGKGGGGGGGHAAKQPVVPAFPPQPPYAGAPVYYHHVIMNATLDVQARLSFTAPDVSFQATNIDSYFPTLAGMYQQGYRMLVFVALPGQTKSYGFAAMGKSQITCKFQGIFRKLFPEEIGQQWELKVEKSLLRNQMFLNWSGTLSLNARSASGATSDNFHVIQTINNISQMGGRLLSVEMTGMAGQELEMQRQMMQRQAAMQYMRTGAMPAFQVSVDVFYEVPHHATSERYNYTIVSCPMDSTFQMSGLRGQFHSVIDWQGVLGQYLSCGWKLVEIFEDHSVNTMTQQSGFTANVNMRKNCLFIFEKPVSRFDDNTPYYEGTMVEHYFQTSVQMHGMGFGGVDMNVVTNWEPLIEHMGLSGWQVVRILETPDVIVQGTFSPTMNTRQLIFFQRRIEGRVEPSDVGQGATPGKGGPPPAGWSPPQGEAGEPPAPPPAYDELYTEKN